MGFTRESFCLLWTQAQAQAPAQIPPPPPPYLGLVKEDVTQSTLAKEFWSFFNNIYEVSTMFVLFFHHCFFQTKWNILMNNFHV